MLSPLRTSLSAALSTLICLASMGCQTASLEGRWSGDLDCGPGTVDISMRLNLEQVASDLYTGDGSVSWDDADGAYWRVDFDAEILPQGDTMATVVPLDIELRHCEEIDLGEMTCADRVDGRWYTNTAEMTGTVDEFFGERCDFELN